MYDHVTNSTLCLAQLGYINFCFENCDCHVQNILTFKSFLVIYVNFITVLKSSSFTISSQYYCLK